MSGVFTQSGGRRSGSQPQNHNENDIIFSSQSIMRVKMNESDNRARVVADRPQVCQDDNGALLLIRSWAKYRSER